MVPPLHLVCASDTTVQDLLSSGNILRLFPFGEARQKEVYPYAVWQTIYGSPENYLGDPPNIDSIGTQIDVYGKTWRSAREVADAIKNAIEASDEAYVVAFNGESKDPQTLSFRISFTAEWLVNR